MDQLPFEMPPMSQSEAAPVWNGREFVVGDATSDELDALCREHLVAYKVPVAFHHVDVLPRSEVGKVLRRELLARAEVRS